MLEGQPLGLVGGLKLLENSKAQMRAVLNHPLLPLFAARKLIPLLDTVSSVPDKEFNRLGKESSILPGYPFRDWINAPVIEKAQAWHLYHPDHGPERIVIRQSFLADDPHARYFCVELLAEQLPYGLAVSKETPLVDLPNNSLSLRPLTDREHLLVELQQWKARFFNDTSESSIERFIAEHHGFKTVFMEVLESGQRRHYPLFQDQLFLERARVGIIQTILEAIYYGMNTEPKLPSLDQFNIGRLVLLNNIRVVPLAYLREAGALDFLEAYFENNPARFGIAKVIEGLSRKTADEFIASLTDEIQRKFIQLVGLSNQEDKALQFIFEEKHTSRSPN